jgi:hypothetical protein
LFSKLLVVIFSGLLQVFCILTITQSELRKRPQGEKLLGLLEAGASRLTNWRADADIRGEFEWIKRLCGWGLGLSVILLLLSAVLRFELPALLVLPFFIISFFGYASLEWVLNWKFIFRFYGVFFIVGIASVIFAFNSQVPEYRRLASLSVQMARLLGFSAAEPSLAITLAAWAGVLIGFFALMTVIALVVSAGIFTPLWLTSKLSDLLRRKFDWDVLWWLAFVVQFVVIILNGIASMM